MPVGLVRTAVPFMETVPYPLAFGSPGRDMKADNHLVAPGSEVRSLAASTRLPAIQPCASTGIWTYPPMAANVAGDVPAGSGLMRLQFLYRFGENIPHDLSEYLRCGVYQNRQLLDAPSRCHNGLSIGRAPPVIPGDQSRFTGITTGLELGPARIARHWPPDFVRIWDSLGSVNLEGCRAAA